MLSRHPRLGRLLLALTEEPQSTRAWAEGAKGEAATAQWLTKLETEGTIRALHDLRCPGLRSNIDHLVVAPTGVYVIDSKRYRGRVEKRSTGSLFRPGPPALYVGGRDRTSLAAGVGKQVSAVTQVLASEDLAVPIHGVLLFTEGDFSLFAEPFAVDGVSVYWPRSLAKLLRRPDELGDQRPAEEIAAVLEARLTPFR